jgi:hypothetical protein
VGEWVSGAWCVVRGAYGRNSLDPSQDTGSSELENSWWLAEYERDSLNLAWKKLEAIMLNNIMAKLKLFVDVIGLYRQIYVVKDLTSRVR